VKSIHHLLTKTTTLHAAELKAGTMVMMLPRAADRDPKRFDYPDALDIDQPNVREYVAFGRGVHACVGAPRGTGGIAGEPGARPRPHGRHPAVPRAPRAGERPPLQLVADLDPPWSDRRSRRLPDGAET